MPQCGIVRGTLRARTRLRMIILIRVYSCPFVVRAKTRCFGPPPLPANREESEALWAHTHPAIQDNGHNPAILSLPQRGEIRPPFECPWHAPAQYLARADQKL